jgi:hypothetical protein
MKLRGAGEDLKEEVPHHLDFHPGCTPEVSDAPPRSQEDTPGGYRDVFTLFTPHPGKNYSRVCSISYI